jgi:N-carbamoyl-L-amino-acid hydrolase
MKLDPKRTLAELKDLRALTSDENGAQRVAFTDTWAKARSWLKTKLEELPVEIHRDEAGNVWTTLQGASPQAVLIGGHIDSVPNGGWLDGSLNLLAGVEILRRISAQYSGHPPVTIRLVDWAGPVSARASLGLQRAPASSTWMRREACRTGMGFL